MNEVLRVGLVGAGYIGAVHSAAYRTVSGTFPDVPRVEMAAVADADEPRARATADAWGWGRAAVDWRTLTQADDIDVIDICVPNALHAAIAIDALQHGKHVVCEKPLADNVDAATAMAAAAAAATTVSQVCFYYRLWPAVEWARQLIDDGRIGGIRHVRGWMLQDYAADPESAMGWRVDPAAAGAGALGDLGSHIVDLARYLAGDVTSVVARVRDTVARDRGARTDDVASLLVDFASGSSGVLEASWALPGHRCDLGFDIVGDAGAIRFSWERCNEIHVLDVEARGFERVLLGPEHPHVGSLVAVAGQGLGYRDAFTIGLGRFLRAAGDGAGDPGPSFADGLQACRVVAAALESNAARDWVDVPSGSEVNAPL